MPRGRPRKKPLPAPETVTQATMEPMFDETETGKNPREYPYRDKLIAEVITDIDGKSIRDFKFEELGVCYDTSLDLKIPPHMRCHSGNDVNVKMFGRVGVDYVRHLMNHFVGIKSMGLIPGFKEDEGLAQIALTKQAEREKRVAEQIVAPPIESSPMSSATS
jgi:hypothetical protein